MTKPLRDWLSFGGGILTALFAVLILRTVVADVAPPGALFLPLLFGAPLGALVAAWIAPERRSFAVAGIAILEVVMARAGAVALARAGAPDAAKYAIATTVVAVAACLVLANGPKARTWVRWAALVVTLVLAIGSTLAARVGGGVVLDLVERQGIPELDRAIGSEVVGGHGQVVWDKPAWDAGAPVGQPHILITGMSDQPRIRLEISAGGFKPSRAGASKLDGLDVRFTLRASLPHPLLMLPVNLQGDDPVYSVAETTKRSDTVTDTLKGLLQRTGIRRELLSRISGFTATYHGIHCTIHGIPGSPGTAAAPAIVERITITGQGTYSSQST